MGKAVSLIEKAQRRGDKSDKSHVKRNCDHSCKEKTALVLIEEGRCDVYNQKKRATQQRRPYDVRLHVTGCPLIDRGLSGSL